VSTTRSRAKYAIFQRDPRAQLLVDDSTGPRLRQTVPQERELGAHVLVHGGSEGE